MKRIALKIGLPRVWKTRKLQAFFHIVGSVFVAIVVVMYTLEGRGQPPSQASVCARPPAGSIVKNPPEIRNPDFFHPASFTVINIAPGQNCYQANGNLEAPTIRLSPGREDLLLRLTNQLTKQPVSVSQQTSELLERTSTILGSGFNHLRGQPAPVTEQYLCVGGMAPDNSTSLHFHGLNIPPKCHQDEVVKTFIQPNESFEYNIQIPKKEVPGLYWYHPHVHMQSEDQVLSGLTGAIIVEGIGSYNKRAAQLPERVFVLRDLPVSDDIPDSDTEQPGKDISINSVPIRYLGRGKYDIPAVIQMEPHQEQFWRVANTASDTYFHLQLEYDGKNQPLELVARDGVPINADRHQDQTKQVFQIIIPPGGRAEFIIKGPGAGVKDALLVTQNYDTGPEGDNDSQRTIAKIDTQGYYPATATPESIVHLTEISDHRFSGLSQEKPVKERKLYFSETDPSIVPSQFYITLEPNQPKVYDVNFKTPDITVQEGTTEDWLIENRTLEVHAFHLHQIHFLVLNSSDESEVGMLRDTITVPYWNGDSKTPFPSVKLRMDFRGAQKGSSIAGTFVYHCHILEHEDGGMMGVIEVKKA
jgi:FtsP/CotA-like multicopper oxidase with cupredoxin domain